MDAPSSVRAYLLFGLYLAVAITIAIALSLALHARSSLSDSAQLSPNSTGQPGESKYAVIIVVDGARPDYFNMVPMPHLQEMMNRGITYTQAFVGQELANTPPSHTTIGTGMEPRHHGVQGFLWEDPRTHTVLNPTSIGAVQNGELEAVIRRHHVPTLAGQIKKANPDAKIVSVSAHKCYAADAMGTPSADYILCALIFHNRWVAQAVGNHRPPSGAINNPRWDVPSPPRSAGFGPAVQQWRAGTENSWTMRYALWAFHRIHYPRVLMINLSETDVLGHFASSDQTARLLMRQFDQLLGQLVSAYRQAGLLDQTNFVITADHGMSRISRHLPYEMLSRAVDMAGATAVHIEHDTSAVIDIEEQEKAQQVAVNVAQLAGNLVDATFYKVFDHGRWLYRAASVQNNVPSSLQAAYRKLADTVAAESGPDVVAIFAPHVSTRQLVVYGYPWRAGHLGPQWDDQHIPLIIAGPAIKAGETSTHPARLVDIAPTIEHLLGAPSGKVDGIVLEDALRSPSSQGLDRQRARASQLSPVVQALQLRSDQG